MANPSDVNVGRHFKFILITITLMTLLFFGMHYKSVFFPPDNVTSEVKAFIEACSFAWKMGFGAILGLLGGKRLN